MSCGPPSGRRWRSLSSAGPAATLRRSASRSPRRPPRRPRARPSMRGVLVWRRRCSPRWSIPRCGCSGSDGASPTAEGGPESTPPGNVKAYFRAVADRFHLDRDDLAHDVAVALGVEQTWMLDPNRVRLLVPVARPNPAPPWVALGGEVPDPQWQRWEWRCERCGRRHLHASAGVCTACRGAIGAPMSPPEDTGRFFETDYYAHLAHDPRGAFRLNCAELTGQTDPVVAAQRQARFQGVFV